MAGVTIRIPNVPTEVRDQLKVRASAAGLTLQEYLLQELHRLARRPTRRELLDRLLAGDRVRLRESPADVIRAHRDGR